MSEGKIPCLEPQMCSAKTGKCQDEKNRKYGKICKDGRLSVWRPKDSPKGRGRDEGTFAFPGTPGDREKRSERWEREKRGPSKSLLLFWMYTYIQKENTLHAVTSLLPNCRSRYQGSIKDEESDGNAPDKTIVLRLHIALKVVNLYSCRMTR